MLQCLEYFRVLLMHGDCNFYLCFSGLHVHAVEIGHVAFHIIYCPRAVCFFFKFPLATECLKYVAFRYDLSEYNQCIFGIID